jgi:vacuolar iron transporter family protein
MGSQVAANLDSGDAQPSGTMRYLSGSDLGRRTRTHIRLGPFRRTDLDGDQRITQPGRVERHRSGRAGWLRAAVLGADDGIVSTASLMIGVAAAAASANAIIVAGLAGLMAGAMSMAAGEYVSVSSQRDAERADTERESLELALAPGRELAELTELYVRRGLQPALARKVAEQLTDADALDAHLREELGILGGGTARPVQAAVVSAMSFALGAALPVVAAVLAPDSSRVQLIAVTALVFLATLGLGGARIGGASVGRGALRVLMGGAAAMAVTALIGRLAGVAGL